MHGQNEEEAVQVKMASVSYPCFGSYTIAEGSD